MTPAPRLFFLFLLMTLLGAFLLSPAVARPPGQRVRIPYANMDTETGSWVTGIVITNLSDTEIPHVYMDICTSDGTWHTPDTIILSLDADPIMPEADNFRADLGPLDAYSMKVGMLDDLFAMPPPVPVCWVEIWHYEPSPFAVTVFVANSSSGFGFNTFFSEAEENTFPDYPVLLGD